jgi:predicted 3-demethylubiquinone-9 3-methyltransferase (glyoxalase superfamily)
MKSKISTFLWFDSNAEDAINFYVSVFNNSKVIELHRMPEGDEAYSQ